MEKNTIKFRFDAIDTAEDFVQIVSELSDLHRSTVISSYLSQENGTGTISAHSDYEGEVASLLTLAAKIGAFIVDNIEWA